MIGILLLVLGAAAGILSGMGIGGGALLIPALTILFGMNQHSAQNINLIYFIPTATVALIAHFKAGRIEKKILPKILIPGILTAIAGSMIALRMDAAILRRIFGGLLLIMGLAELKKGWRKNAMDSNSFLKLKEQFALAEVDSKIDMYVEAQGLSQEQYKELLRLFPYSELYRLEEALG